MRTLRVSTLSALTKKYQRIFPHEETEKFCCKIIEILLMLSSRSYTGGSRYTGAATRERRFVWTAFKCGNALDEK